MFCWDTAECCQAFARLRFTINVVLLRRLKIDNAIDNGGNAINNNTYLSPVLKRIKINLLQRKLDRLEVDQMCQSRRAFV